MKQKQVKVRQRNPQAEMELRKQGIHPMIAQLWASRGVDATAYEESGIANLVSPFLLKDIEKASEILIQTILEGKRLVVAADYDNDGAAGAAVAVRGLKMLALAAGLPQDQVDWQIQFKVPNRMIHGYGLGAQLVDDIQVEFEPDLIVTVDNGISSMAGVDRANELSIGVVVTDHHLQGDSLPNALAIVNPNQHACTFPSKALCGCGVMYYVLLVMRAKMRGKQFTKEQEPDFRCLLDIVAMATVADVVSLADENNRRLVAAGLARIRAGKANAGVKALFDVARKDTRKAVTTDFGFLTGPRINAAGRLDDMTTGIRCLISDNPEECQMLAQTLDSINRQRREIEGKIKEEAMSGEDLQKIVDSIEAGGEVNGVILSGDWHHGVIGIVCSRIKDMLYRPVVMFAPDEDPTYVRGSGRSIPGVHLRDVLDYCAKKMPEGACKAMGGHAAAAGCTWKAEYLDELKVVFNEAVAIFAEKGSFDEVIYTDGAIPEEHMTLQTADLIGQYVWGQNFPEPVFYDTFTVVGRKILKDKHTKLWLMKGNTTFEAVKWNWVEEVGQTMTITYKIQRNDFSGGVQLMLENVHDMQGSYLEPKQDESHIFL